MGGAGPGEGVWRSSREEVEEEVEEAEEGEGGWGEEGGGVWEEVSRSWRVPHMAGGGGGAEGWEEECGGLT